jgi:hypothetical protein
MAARDDGVRPEVEEWYMDVHSQDRFKVLGIDDGEIQVQHEDGDLESFDAADWQARLFTRTDGPNDPGGALPLEDGDGGFDEESFDASQPQLPDVQDGNVLLPGEGVVRKARGVTGSDEEEA